LEETMVNEIKLAAIVMNKSRLSHDFKGIELIECVHWFALVDK
jgi:hypothetical protein